MLVECQTHDPQRVGKRLVERTTRRLAPTAAGRHLAERARQVLAAYGETLGEVAERPGGSLQGLIRITAPLVFGRRHVTPVVASFLDAHPHVRIELVLSDRNLELIDEGFDLAVRIGRLADSGHVARRVGEVRRVVFASPDYLARRGRPRNPSDLPKHDVVFYSGRPSPMEWRFKTPARAVRLSPRLMLTDIDAILLAARMGQGIGRSFSYRVADDLSSGTLVRLLAEFEPVALPVQLVVPTARHMPPGVRAFLDHAARALAALAVIKGVDFADFGHDGKLARIIEFFSVLCADVACDVNQVSSPS
jgi:DNA-binding transcriptional LysR family regulator